MNRPEETYEYASRPSKVVVFFRTFLPWQLIRFVAINIKMIRMLRRCHACRVDSRPDSH